MEIQQNAHNLTGQRCGMIIGRAYQDIDNSGRYSPQDIELGGIEVSYTNGIISGSVVTRSDGIYCITGLPEGTWFLSVLPVVWGLMLSYVESANNALHHNGTVKVVLDQNNSQVMGINFGYRGRYLLSGQVTITKHQRVIAVARAEVVIVPIDKRFTERTVCTDELGYYRVCDLLPYEYHVLLQNSHPLSMLEGGFEAGVVNLNRDIIFNIELNMSFSVSAHSAMGY